jgi:hypothetical protein
MPELALSPVKLRFNEARRLIKHRRGRPSGHKCRREKGGKPTLLARADEVID